MKFLPEYEDLYVATLNKWGEEAQYDQAVEECAELITALKHLKRGRIQPEQVADELADVALMVAQLSYMLGVEKVQTAIENKVEKLKILLQK